MYNFGAIIGLMAATQHYQYWTIGDIRRLIMPPVLLGQSVVCRQDGNPVAFATWAWLSDEALAEIESRDRGMCAEDFNSGDNLWIAEGCAPYGHIRVLARHIKDRFSSVTSEARFKRKDRVGWFNG